MTTPNIERTHGEDIESRAQTHEHQMATLRQGKVARASQRQQWSRIAITVMIVLIWLTQTGYVTYHAVQNPAILTDIEKFIALIGVTGAVAIGLIQKLSPENGD